MNLADADNNRSPDFTEALPQSLLQMDAHLSRYSSAEETAYLFKLAKRDAWSSLYQWLFPAIFLTLLVIGFWLYRKELEFFIQHTKNPQELNTFVGIVFKFFVFLLHLALVGYVCKIQRMLEHFRYSGSASSAQRPVRKRIAQQHGQITAGASEHEITLFPQGVSSDSPSYPIFRITAKPASQLSLALTSRSGLRRYRWHYYMDDLALTPLGQARSALPLYVQKKSWKDLGQASAEELEALFPDSKWLELCLQCERKNMNLQADVVFVEYYDFHFYYLCALQPSSLSVVNELIDTGILHSAEQEYRLQEESGKSR